MESVNRGLGIENARKFTVNPLVFLAIAKSNGSVAPVADIRIAANITPPVTLVVPPTPVSQAMSFTDVPATHPNARAIAFMKSQGIALGQAGKYAPNRSVTRAELVKMAYFAAKTPLSTDTRMYFTDVPRTSVFLSYINTARASKAVSGYADGTFKPDTAVTRAEGLKILLSILGVSLDTVNGPVYLDVAKRDWSAPYVLWSRDN